MSPGSPALNTELTWQRNIALNRGDELPTRLPPTRIGVALHGAASWAATGATRRLRGGSSAAAAAAPPVDGVVKPLGPAHAAFLQTFEGFLESFAAALERACTHDKGGWFGGGPSKRAHLKADRAAMQQVYNHLYDCYTSGLAAARTPQQLVLGAMQVRGSP